MDPLFALRNHPLLTGFSDDGVRIVASAATERVLQQGESLFLSGSPSDGAWLLTSGEVSILLETSYGPQELAVLRAPDSLGDLSLLRALGISLPFSADSSNIAKPTRRVTARAKTRVEALFIAENSFAALWQQRPQACAKFLLRLFEKTSAALQEGAPTLVTLVASGLTPSHTTGLD